MDCRFRRLWHDLGSIKMSVWTMTLFIQRAEHRDTQAIQAKLDELLRADRSARQFPFRYR